MADVKFIITVDEAGAIKKLESFDKALHGVGETAKDKASPALSGLWLKFAAGQLAADALKKGIGFLVRELKSTVGAAIESEAKTRALESALATTGRTVDAILPGLVAFSKTIQEQTTQTDEAALSAMALLTQLTDLDEQGIKKATEGAAGMATVFGIDLESAARNVAKAMEGNYTMMSRYIPKLKDCKTEEEKHSLVMETLSQWYGRAKSETDTFGGSLKQLGNMWDEVKEAVGRAVTENKTIKELIDKIKGGIVDLIESGKLEEWVDNASKAISALIKIFEGLYTAVKTVFDILDKLPTYSKSGKKFYEETMGWVEEKSAPFKKACEDFRDSLTYLKIPLENLRIESEKGPENWKNYTDTMKNLDDAMKTAKGPLEKYFEQFKDAPAKVKPTSTETRTFTKLVKDELTPALAAAGWNLFNFLGGLKDAPGYFNAVLPPARDMKEVLEKATGIIYDMPWSDIPKKAKKATKETKGYFDGLYNDIAKGFGDMISKWMSGALTFRDFMKGIWDDIKQAFFRMIGEMVADAVLGLFKSFFTNIKDTATSAIGDVGKALAGAASGWATGIGAAVGSFLGTVLAGIISGAPSGHAQQQMINDMKDARNFLAEIRNWFFSAGTGFGGASYDFITGHVGEWLTSIKISTDLTRDQMIPRLDRIVEYTALLKKIKWGQGGVDTITRGPTLFGAGEHRPERVMISPNINIGTSSAPIIMDGRAVARVVFKYLPEMSRDGYAKIHQRGIINN